MKRQQTFLECLREKKAWYKSLDPLNCPILNEKVYFTSKGFNHLKYSSGARAIKEYHYKLSLLSFIIPVIENSSTIFDYKQKVYSKRLGKYFEIWELREDVKNEFIGSNKVHNISVVLRRIGNGNIHFYSIWKNKTK